jgi:hypothetical protein
LTCLFHFCNFTFYICDCCWSYFVTFHFSFIFYLWYTFQY